VDTGAGLDVVAKRKIPHLFMPEIEHDRSAHSIVTILTELTCYLGIKEKEMHSKFFGNLGRRLIFEFYKSKEFPELLTAQ
jgi:hypothetical protein